MPICPGGPLLSDFSQRACSQRWNCLQNAERLDSEIIYNRDFDYDYFGFKVRGR